MKHLLSLFLLIASSAIYAQENSVVIKGRVTDYDGQPIDSVTLWWQRPDFSIATSVVTDKEGYYSIQVPKGKYQSVTGIYLPTYPRFAPPGLSEADQRLEFWAWDAVVDRDTTFNFRYNRMEAYGIRAFHVPGGKATYQVYVRPMSLTRAQAWEKNKTSEMLFAPNADKLKAVVWIDGEEVTLLMKQELKECVGTNQWFNAYLLTVDFPKKATANPYHIFKVELTDLENGDRGEGLYYMEKENYYK